MARAHHRRRDLLAQALESRRLFSAGDPDVTFSGDGQNVIDLPGVSSELANATVVQGDGKIVVAGRATVGAETDFFVSRLLSGGSLDTSFGGGDGVISIDFAVNDEAFDVALQDDGKIVVVGASSSGAGTNARQFAVARLTTAGALDATFSGDGRTTVDFGINADAQSVALHGTSIFVGGYKDLGATGQFALAKLLPNGSPDTAYSADGEVFFGFGGNNDSRCYDIAVDSAGRVVMAGYDENFSVAQGGRNFAYARVGTNALLDSSFSNDGLLITDFAGADDEARAVAIGIDGRISVGGFSPGTGGNDFTATRLTEAGVLDTTFNGDGAFRLNLGGVEAVDDIAVHPDGDITLAGQTSVGSFQAALVRIRATDGQLATTFGDGGDGIQFMNFGAIDDGFAVAVDPNNLNTIVAGTDGGGRLAVGRVTDLIDRNFAPAGGVARRAVAAYPEHRLVVVADERVERLRSDGSLDTTFSSDGIVPLPANEFPYDIVVDSQQRIIVLTSFSNSTFNDARVRRILPSGAFDTTFSGDGMINFHFGNETSDQYRCLAIDSQDRILIGGGRDLGTSSNTDFAVARLTTAGALDPTFDGDGMAIYEMSIGGGSVVEHVGTMLIQPDGKIVCIGQADTGVFDLDIALLRLNTNGSKDSTFGLLGEVRQDIGGRDNFGFGADLDSAGRILVGGICSDSLNPNNPDDGYIARFEADGDLDTTFSGDGMILFTGVFSPSIADVSVSPDGRITAFGALEVPGQGRLLVVRRFLANTQPDTTFAGDGIWIAPGSQGFPSFLVDDVIYASSNSRFHRLNVQPAVVDFEFLFDTSPHQLVVKFNDDVGDSLTNFDLVIRNTTGNVQLSPTTHPLTSYDRLTNTATFTFSPRVNDGNHTVTFAAGGIFNRQQMNLAGEPEEKFFFLTGDANHDRRVDIGDFAILSANFNRPGTFTTGDFNYTGQVEIGDFSILASKFNTSLPAARPPPAVLPAAPDLSRGWTRMNAEFSKERIGVMDEIGLL